MQLRPNKPVLFLLAVALILTVSLSIMAQEKAYIVGSSWYGHAPAWVAIEEGYFAEIGFDVEYKFVASSTDRLMAVSSGSALFASLGEMAMITPMAMGNKNFYWVGSQDIAPGFEGVVAQEWIKSIADLKGKKVAVQAASSTDLTLHLLAKEYGLNSYRDINLINISYSEMYTAFANKNIDAAVVWEPTFSQLQELPGAHVLGKDTDTEIYRQFASMTSPDVLIINRRYADRNPDKAKAFIRAYFKGVEFVRDNPDEAARIIKKYVGQDLEQIAQGLKGFIWLDAQDQAKVLSPNGLFGQIEYVIDFLKETGRITRKPNYHEWVRPDLLP